MIIYVLTDSLKLETAKRYEFPNDKTLGEALEELGYKSNEVDAYFSEGEITDFEKSYSSCLITAKIQGKHVKNILKVVVGAALLIASGGTLGAIAGFLHTTGTVVHALGAGLLLSGGGSLIKGQMKMPQISSFGSESIEQSYEWNVGNLSTSKGPKGVTFGSNVIPEGELLAYRTFGETDDEPITSTRTDTWVDTTFIAGNSTKAGTTTKRQNVTNRYGMVISQNVTVQKYKHSKTVTSVIGSKITDSSQILELLIGAGEGPVTIDTSSIKINGTPISDIAEAEYAVRSGTNNQSAFDSVIDNQTFNLSVNASTHQILFNEVEANWPDAVTYTTPSECQSVEIALSSNAWYLMDMTSGAHNKAYLKYQIRYRKQGTSAWTLKEVTTTYPILANRAYYRSTPIKLPSKGIWEFQVQNLSAKLNYQKQLLSEAEFTQIPDRAVIDIKLVSITGYTNDNRSYPNTALLYLRLPATQAINGNLPNITWRQSRSNCYVWTGSGYVQKPLDNLAWAIYDCLVQIRLDQFDNTLHVLGWNKDKVDYSAFVEFANFCESINAKGNWFLSKKTSVYELVQDLALSCRANIGFRYGKICPFWDCPKEMTQIFTAGNMIAGSYNGGYLLPANRATQLDCTFNDENNNYESTTIRVSLDGIDDGSDAGAITFVGLSSVNAVYNAAYYLLRRNKYLKRTFNFTAGRDALVAEVGDVVGIQLDVMQWGAGGRILGVNGNKITLDRNVTLQSGTTYSLKITHPDGTLERKTPDETSGTYATLTFSQHPFSIPVNLYDVYSFGVINAETKPFKIESITSDYNQVNFQIECSEYNENVYVEGSAPEIDYSRLNAGISDYTAKTNANGDIDLTWKATEGTAYVKVYVGNTFAGIGVNGFTINGANSTSNIKLIPVSDSGYDGTSIVSEITANIGTPSMPVAPNVVPFSTGVVAIFEPVPENEYISQLVIFEGGVEIARTPVTGATVSIQINLGGGAHNLVASYRNINNKLGTGRSFTATPTLIDAPDVVADWIVSGVFETAEGVGENVNGVRFNSNGIQGWYNGSCLFDLNAHGSSRIGGWYIGSDKLYSNNIEINSSGYLKTIDFASGHKGWYIGKDGDVEFQDATIRGTMTSVNFVKDTVSAVGGSLMILSAAEVQSFTKTTSDGQNILCEDCIDLITEDDANLITEQSGTSAYYSVVVDDASTFAATDILRIRDTLAVQDLWLGVVSKSSNTLNCVMLYGSELEPETGMCIVNYGKPGNGGILLRGNAPLMDMFTHDGQPWVGTDCWVRIGNLNGIGGITDNRYGLFIGSATNHFLRYDEHSGKLSVRGEVVVTGGATYNSIVHAQSSADEALAFRNAVANTGYTSIKGGSITTGTIKNSTYVEPSDQKFSTGSGFDLDNGHIHTPYFYSNSNGAGIKGYVEATSGKIGGFTLESGFLTYESTSLSLNDAVIRLYNSTGDVARGFASVDAKYTLAGPLITYTYTDGGVTTLSMDGSVLCSYKKSTTTRSSGIGTSGLMSMEVISNTTKRSVTVDYQLGFNWYDATDSSNTKSLSLNSNGFTYSNGSLNCYLSPTGFHQSGANSQFVDFTLTGNTGSVITFNKVYGFNINCKTSGKYVSVDTNGNISASGTVTSSKGTCQGASDENMKTRIKDVNVLNILKTLRVKKWNYKDDLANAHIGPMARDFNEAFKVNGESPKLISFHDTAGVALRAVQELSEEVDDFKRQYRFLKKLIIDKGLITELDVETAKIISRERDNLARQIQNKLSA